MNEEHICAYCGAPATHQFKNGKWCCNSNRNQCPAMKKIRSEKSTAIHQLFREQHGNARQFAGTHVIDSTRPEYPDKGDHVCVYCGGYAEYRLKDGILCCSPHRNSCPSLRLKNSLGGNHSHSQASSRKGQTKETNPSIAKASRTLKEGYASGRIVSTFQLNPGKVWLGRKHTEETKKKMSTSHKAICQGKSIWSTQIEKRRSYAEQYFAGIFTDAEQQYHVDRYFLDFAWPDKKVYVEIDGEQHYNDPKVVAHDVDRTKNLKECGWQCIARIRWSSFKRMQKEQQACFVEDIKLLIEKAPIPWL